MLDKSDLYRNAFCHLLGRKVRMTLVKILESTNFIPENFQSKGEQDWMVKSSLIAEDPKSFHPNVLENIGRELYQSLFPMGSKVERVLQGSLRQAESKSTQLHIQLKFEADVVQRSRLSDYPWELLHDGHSFLAHPKITLSRYIAFDKATPPNLPPVNRINVLLISSTAFDPENGLQRLPPVREREALLKGIEMAAKEGHIKLNELPYATIKDLRAYLVEHQGNEFPHVIHFDGHGLFGKRCNNEQCRTMHRQINADVCKVCKTPLQKEPQGYLVFESDQGSADYISAKEFGDLLQQSSLGGENSRVTGVTLAVLSACQSSMALLNSTVFNGIAQNLISNRIPAVVAMQYSVTIAGAAKFSEDFYRSLGRKDSLARAVSLGRSAMGIEGNQWYRPVLYLRWGDNKGGQLFNNMAWLHSFLRSLRVPERYYPRIEDVVGVVGKLVKSFFSS